jgi:hypothetical protein
MRSRALGLVSRWWPCVGSCGMLQAQKTCIKAVLVSFSVTRSVHFGFRSPCQNKLPLPVTTICQALMGGMSLAARY